MTLLETIQSRAQSDPAFAQLLAERRDADIAALLSVGRTRTRKHLITERGVISALGPVDGEALLQDLYGFGSMPLPDGQLKASQAGIARVISWLKPPAEGVDIGDPLTQQLLGVMASFGLLNPASVNALLALATVPDPIPVSDVSDAINGGV